MAVATKVFILLAAIPAAHALAQDAPVAGIKTCSMVSLARPGFGASYRGPIRNDDYGLSLTIPNGLTGWGADPVAPFHGFTIFLPFDPERSSCIVFEIHVRVDAREARTGRRGVRIMIGGASGWREEITRPIGGAEFTNVAVQFSITRGRHTDEGTIWLVTPIKRIRESRSLFDAFLAGIAFDRR